MGLKDLWKSWKEERKIKKHKAKIKRIERKRFKGLSVEEIERIKAREREYQANTEKVKQIIANLEERRKTKEYQDREAERERKHKEYLKEKENRNNLEYRSCRNCKSYRSGECFGGEICEFFSPVPSLNEARHEWMQEGD